MTMASEIPVDIEQGANLKWLAEYVAADLPWESFRFTKFLHCMIDLGEKGKEGVDAGRTPRAEASAWYLWVPDAMSFCLPKLW